MHRAFGVRGLGVADLVFDVLVFWAGLAFLKRQESSLNAKP